MRGAALAVAACGALLAAGCVTRATESATPRWAVEGGATAVPAARSAEPVPPPPASPATAAHPPPAEPPAAAPGEEGGTPPSRVEADTVELVVPAHLVGDLRRDGPTVAVGGLVAVGRAAPPAVTAGGDDLSIVAEGGVVVTYAGRRPRREGPFALYVFRNGRELRR